MSTYRPYKAAIDFEEIKSQRSSLDTWIEVNLDWIANHPEDREKAEQEIAKTKEKIPALDAILVKEPPPPELPPGKPLIKVSGVLEEFEALCVMGYFTDREYDPAAFAREEDREQFGALLMAMVGNTSNTQTRVRVRDVCDFVRGKINGVPFHGWLGLTTAKVGDDVELAVTEQEGHYVVYAIAHPELRVISMTPRCKQGIHANAKYQIGSTWYFSLFVFSVFMIMWVFVIREDIVGYIEYMSLFCILMAIVFSPLVYFSCIRNPKPTFRLAEEIFTVLSFPNPTDINLYQFTLKKLKEIKASSSNGELSKGSERVLPDKSCYSSYYYYY
ncbi:putative type VI secretion system effector [Photorhabdus sp. CRCIA-P01]|uniref:putative type VI secretion system effector n=1 Tax=Photorhabdus sp. CRCIA-P01 TaxID=2019570 RepID=UPI000E59BB23|nr:putative type VI secretion system effector [Photorhabdus sp. CRCIA-P01]